MLILWFSHITFRLMSLSRFAPSRSCYSAPNICSSPPSVAVRRVIGGTVIVAAFPGGMRCSVR